MTSKNPPVTVNIEDKLLSQDRWIAFLLILGMIAIFWTVYEIEQVNKEFEETQRDLESAYIKRNLSANSGLEHIY